MSFQFSFNIAKICHMKMGKNMLFYALILLNTDCINSNNEQNKNKIEDLIKSKSNQIVFLSFWPGMSDNEFESVLQLEESKGNLIDRSYKFVLSQKKHGGFDLRPINEQIPDELLFKISNDKASGRIILNYQKDLQGYFKFNQNNKSAIPECFCPLGDNIYREICKQFDLKYKKVKKIGWTDSNKVININYHYSLKEASFYNNPNKHCLVSFDVNIYYSTKNIVDSINKQDIINLSC
jgi:hypothetical protein